MLIMQNVIKNLKNMYLHFFIIKDCHHSCLACKYYKICIESK